MAMAAVLYFLNGARDFVVQQLMDDIVDLIVKKAEYLILVLGDPSDPLRLPHPSTLAVPYVLFGLHCFTLSRRERLRCGIAPVWMESYDGFMVNLKRAGVVGLAMEECKNYARRLFDELERSDCSFFDSQVKDMSQMIEFMSNIEEKLDDFSAHCRSHPGDEWNIEASISEFDSIIDEQDTRAVAIRRSDAESVSARLANLGLGH